MRPAAELIPAPAKLAAIILPVRAAGKNEAAAQIKLPAAPRYAYPLVSCPGEDSLTFRRPASVSIRHVLRNEFTAARNSILSARSVWGSTPAIVMVGCGGGIRTACVRPALCSLMGSSTCLVARNRSECLLD